ncbi:MAG: ORF6N domain-containing protein [Candidatus Binatia bacterium]
MANRKLMIPRERIDRSILMMRGQKVMLDVDLANLYGVTTKGLDSRLPCHTLLRNMARSCWRAFSTVRLRFR